MDLCGKPAQVYPAFRKNRPRCITRLLCQNKRACKKVAPQPQTLFWERGAQLIRGTRTFNFLQTLSKQSANQLQSAAPSARRERGPACGGGLGSGTGRGDAWRGQRLLPWLWSVCARLTLTLCVFRKPQARTKPAAAKDSFLTPPTLRRDQDL